MRAKHPSLILAAAIALSTSFAAAQDAASQTPEEFFKGKNINVYIGFSPGGSYDFFGRLVARHIGRHIPGAPSSTPNSMPGAGSFTAANWLYAAAPKDGTAIGIVSQTMAIEEVLQSPAVKFKASQFNWIGRATNIVEIGFVNDKSKAATIADAKLHEIPVAGTGPGSPSEGYPRLLNALTGTRFKIIGGFRGSTEGMLAVERGEVDGALTSWQTMKVTRKAEYDQGKLRVLVQYAPQREPDLPVPAVVELANNEADRSLLAFYASGGEVGRSFLAPPGVPADRVTALRRAFDAMMKDKEFIADVEKAKAEFNPMTGEALQKLISDTASVSPVIVERMRKLLEIK
jgi:tripartite-type tricarboxylate transporter receptor subunit TctC